MILQNSPRMLKALLLTLFTATVFAQGSAGVLPESEVQKLMPTSVFFSGQSATVQMRNSAGIRFGDGHILLAGLVDTGGYSSGIRDRYQFYLLTDLPITIAGKPLPTGAYGCGFLAQGLVVMDLGARDLFQAVTTLDPQMKHPRPLQITAGDSPNEFRLYLGRNYVTLRAK